MSSYSNYSVEILVGGRPITSYTDSVGDVFVEGRPNSEYTISVKNNTHKRVKAIVSVDGLSVIDGKPAGDNSRGYLIDGYGVVQISGWRVSDSEVRKFVFGNKKSSYSNKTGQGTLNVGAIGVMIFSEVQQNLNWVYHTPQPFYPYNPVWISNTSAMPQFSAARGIARSYGSAINAADTIQCSAQATSLNNLGTQQGGAMKSNVSEVQFNAETTPSKLLVVYYDDRRGLEARGIVVDQRKSKPDPFPNSKYCTVVK